MYRGQTERQRCYAELVVFNSLLELAIPLLATFEKLLAAVYEFIEKHGFLYLFQFSQHQNMKTKVL
jgi:hypothetical protein